MKNQIKQITDLIGDPIRMTVLWTLLDGRAYTATELTIVTDTSAQNMSMHLNKLVKAQLLSVEKQGRHKYYRIYNQDVAYAVEAMTNLIPQKRQPHEDREIDSGIKYCRTCYDHLAGKIGVSITEKLVADKLIELKDKTYVITEKGIDFFEALNISIDQLQKQRRSFARPCLDWSERKYHLAGALGAAFLNKMVELDWLRREQDTRVMIPTAKGSNEIYKMLKIKI